MYLVQNYNHAFCDLYGHDWKILNSGFKLKMSVEVFVKYGKVVNQNNLLTRIGGRFTVLWFYRMHDII